MGFLRLFFAVAVVAAHAGPIFGIALVSGRTAVECFFVISGFYMAMVLEKKYLRLPTRAWRTFMGARLLRLLPIYALMLVAGLCLVLLGGAIYIGDRAQPMTQLFELPAVTWIPIVFSNLVVFTQDWSMFSAIDPAGYLHFSPDVFSEASPAYRFFLVPQAWTVGLELTFYLLAPGLARRSNRTLGLILVSSVALRFLFAFMGLRGDPWSYRFFPFELSLFVAGMLAFRFRDRLRGLLRVRGIWPLVIVGGALALLPVLGAWPAINGVALLAFPFAVAALVPAIFESTSKSRVDRWVGEYSYPVYMIHVLVLSIFASVGVNPPGVVAVLACLAAASVVVFGIDRPLEVLRQRRIRMTLARAGVSESGRTGQPGASASPADPSKERLGHPFPSA